MKSRPEKFGIKTRRAGLLYLCLVPALLFAAARPARGQEPAAPTAADSVAVALPASGEVLIDNRRGGVQVEVWNEDGVAIAVAATKAKDASRRSPARVERRAELLSITVARAAAASAPRVDLTIRVPSQARLKVMTADGDIVVRGVPASLNMQTISGDMRLGVAHELEVDITAHSLNGVVSVGEGVEQSGSPAREVRGKFRTRKGAAGRLVNLFSGRGRISLAGLEETARADDNAAPAPRRAAAIPDDITERGTRTTPRTAPTPQIETSQEVEEDDVVRVESDLVTLNVSIVDRANGRGIMNLALDDFKLYEDGAEQQLAHFETANAPFDLVLLIDLSGSTAKVTDLIRTAALRFIAAARPQDRISVISFAGAFNVVSPLTVDRRSLRSSINAMERPAGDTRLYDSLGSAMEYLDRETKNSSRRRAVILMSDGLDSTMPNVTGTGSTLAFEELRSRVQEFDGVLYTIWTSTEYEAFSPQDIQPETFDLAHDRMKELAEAGGGVFYDVERLEDLGNAYERVIQDLGTVYSLSYRPTNKQRDGRWRAIRIRLPRHPNAVARGKRGYNAN